MFALLSAALVMHHIEGVCKPRSPMAVVLDRFAAYVAQRDQQAAIERATQRAETRRQSAAERAESRRQARAERTTGRTTARPERQSPRAIEPPQKRPADWQQSDAVSPEAERHYHREA